MNAFFEARNLIKKTTQKLLWQIRKKLNLDWKETSKWYKCLFLLLNFLTKSYVCGKAKYKFKTKSSNWNMKAIKYKIDIAKNRCLFLQILTFIFLFVLIISFRFEWASTFDITLLWFLDQFVVVEGFSFVIRRFSFQFFNFDT